MNICVSFQALQLVQILCMCVNSVGDAFHGPKHLLEYDVTFKTVLRPLAVQYIVYLS